jgi:hypothetical protein
MKGKLIALVGVLAAAACVLVLPAAATYPGVNGPITYSKNLAPGPEAGFTRSSSSMGESRPS